MGLFNRDKPLNELQEQDEYLTTNVSVEQKKALLRELKRRNGGGSWRLFSDNGKVSGINFDRIRAWLKAH